ncbi:uncharacterized protein LOC134229066 [Saccostrea cucullata]|uniref:uncharacterized protein LOC134229066 n=1 Tax=Saccostrea cuccullata TaxID=36930 RepID=UPI002ED004C9
MMDSDEYKFRPNRKYQGLAVVVVNFTKERSGSVQEIMHLRITFELLGFKVKIYTDLTKKEFNKVVVKYATGDKLKDYDSFVFAVSTHGCEQEKVENDIVVHHHALLMNDGQYYYTSTVLEKFRDCKALEAKPKMFFVQACRIPISKTSEIYKALGFGFSEGVTVHVDHAEPPQKKRKPDKTDNQDLDSDPKSLSPMDTNVADTAMASRSGADKKGDTRTSSEKALSDSQAATEIMESGDKADTRESGDKTDTRESGDKTDTRESGDKTDESGDDVDPARGIRYLPPQPALHVTSVPCYNDMLIVFASPAGHYAFRNTITGSYLWKYLYDSVITEYNGGRLNKNRTNFLYVLNDVAARMSATDFGEGGKYKNVTCFVHKLSKDIIFSKGEKM